MEIGKLKDIVEKGEGINCSNSDNYVSIYAIEQVLKNKQKEMSDKIEEFRKYMSMLLKRECRVINDYDVTKVYYKSSFFSTSESELIIRETSPNCYVCYYHDYDGRGNDKRRIDIERLLNGNQEIKDVLTCFGNFACEFDIKESLKTNLGLYLNVYQSLGVSKILFGDRNYSSEYSKLAPAMNELPFEFSGKEEVSAFEVCGRAYYYVSQFKRDEDILNFYYIKDLIDGMSKIGFENDECRNFLNESLIKILYSKLRVDISSFDKETQEEMRSVEKYCKLKLHESENEERAYAKKIQLERLQWAYENLVQAIKMLNNLQTEIELEPIKLDNISSIFFKNNGQPDVNGAIQIEDIFRNNMLLRMIDLSEINLTNVDIRDMDFSGTNIHIDPQTIYNKDMTNVKAVGVKFSPFFDRFDGVILDGAVIDDWEAMINLETVKSYNNQTQINESNRKINK